jgi:thiosulfate/3-mercaptopyruvate sulfurtransferase
MMDKQIAQTLAIVALLIAVLLAVVDTGRSGPAGGRPAANAAPPAWAATVEAGLDHLTPEALARTLVEGAGDLLLVDLRPAAEFATFHLPGSVNLDLVLLLGPEGTALLDAHAGRDVVLVSNGMTHPAQAWVALREAGRTNVRILEEGLDGFVRRVLTPPSLKGPTTAARAGADRPLFEAVRARVLGTRPPRTTAAPAAPDATAPAVGRWATDPPRLERPTVVSTDWVAARLGRIVLLDTREKAEDYALAHLVGAVWAPVAATRETRGGTADELLPPEALAAIFAAWGVSNDTEVVAYGGDRLQDPTHLALSLIALGHARVAVMEGGFGAWAAEGRAATPEAPTPAQATYTPRADAFDFLATLDDVAAASRAGGDPPILDVRPQEAFEGEQGKEARGGRIPASLGRPYTEDVLAADGGAYWRPRPALRDAYAALGLAPDAPLIVSCRTGHQASQTWFTLRYLLGYRDVRWYDGSWKEWALHPELPAETGPATKSKAR